MRDEPPTFGPFKLVEICGHNVWVRADSLAGQNDIFIATGPLRGEYGLDQIAKSGFPMDWIVDIGSFVGTFSMKAKQLWPNAKLIAFEPSPETAALYKMNTSAYNDIIFYEAAATGRGQPEMVHLIANDDFHAARRVAEIITQFGEPLLPGEPVKSLPLLEVLRKNGNPDIALLKIDAEGVEADLLEDLNDVNYLERIHWIRGEWHYFPSIPRIEYALQRTHNIYIERNAHPWGLFEAVKKA